MEPQGEPIARGRAADVYADGPDRVLRRYREPGAKTGREATLMAYLHAAGYPVPEVFDADGPDIVMARISGPTMLATLERRPWTARLQARILAGLHQGLHLVDAPDDLPRPWGPSGGIVHLDLHPDNVILAPGGPVVIDWSNAVGGPPGIDLARTWLMVAAMGGASKRWQRTIEGTLRRSFVKEFLAYADREAARAWFDAAVELTLLDPHVTTTEAAAIRALQRRTPAPLATPGHTGPA